MSKRFSLFKKKDTEKRKSTTSDLNTSLLASNNVQLQPKSFFRNDADDASSVSSHRETDILPSSLAGLCNRVSAINMVQTRDMDGISSLFCR